MARLLHRSSGALDERSILAGIYVARLSVANALALAATLVRSNEAQQTELFPFVLIIVGIPLVFTAISLAYSRRREVGAVFLASQILHDLLLTSVAVVLTGGVASEFSLIYVLLIAVAGLLLGFRGAMITAIGCVVVYLGIAYQQIVPLLPVIGDTIELPNLTGRVPAVLWSLALTSIVFLLVGVASGFAARRLHFQRERLDELEQQLAGSRISAQDILNTVESGILSINVREEIDFVNDTARALLGLDAAPGASDLRGRRAHRGVARLYELLLETLRSGKEVEYLEFPLVGRDDVQRSFSVTTTVLYDSLDRKRGAAAILKDIENVKRLEELARQADRLKSTAELAAGMAHEIQNPLAAIRSSVELMSGDERMQDQETQRLMGLVVRETDRLTDLIGDFMAFSRMTLRTRERVDLGAVIQDAVEVEGVAAGGEGPVVESILPDEPQWVEGDYNLLKQVCLNLVDNARTAISDPRTGRVEVRVRETATLPGIELATGPFITLEVQDNGAGISADLRERIFDPFFTTRNSGFGMGLAIVHRIVDLHGGVVWVDSEPGRGSTFRVALPRAS